MSQLTRMSSLSKKLKSPLGRLPEIVRPTEILSKFHDKTHFKAATSIFLDHHGSLKHRHDDETTKQIEKMLNDQNVKKNLQNILEKTSKHVSRLREQHTKTPDFSGTNTNRNVRKFALDSKFSNLNNSDLNDRLSTNRMNSSITAGTSDASPFGAAMRQAAKRMAIPCPVENNPIRDIIKEEGRNLSPS